MPTSPVTWHQDAELAVAYPPLGFLHGRNPLRSLEQRDLAIAFGIDARD